MNWGGYANRVAWIDLTKGTVKYRPIDDDDARKYIGARGLGVKYVFDNGPHVDPLSPDNLLCFMNGPLTGTDVNLSGRMAVVTKSPLTGTITDSHHGGWSAARMKWAGLDGLVFKGRAGKPVYAYVENGEVSLPDASDLWGMGVHETIKTLQARHGDERTLSVIAIGPAGENLVKFACWINENDRASGRGGTGCVGGAKGLKAIVIRGKHSDRPRPMDKEAFDKAHRQALAELLDERVVTSPRKGGLSVYGTNVLMNMTNAIGAMPTNNSQTTNFPEHELLSGEYVRENVLVNDPTCHACPVACKKEVEIRKARSRCIWRASVRAGVVRERTAATPTSTRSPT
jgi:aldehyde:ferredoxin oxidoreductase